MKQVETNFLVYDLLKQKSIKTPCNIFKFIFTTLGLSILSILYFLLTEDFRADLDIVLAGSIFSCFYIQLIIFLTNMLIGCYLCYQLTIPARINKLRYKILNVLFYCIWLVWLTIWLINLYYNYKNGTEFFFITKSVGLTLSSLIFPIIILFYFVRKGYVLYKFRTFIAIILTALSFAGLVSLFVA